MRELHMIQDLQYGSCGKGLFAGYLARKVKPDTLVTAWAPNAGHTFVNEQDERFVHIVLPNGIEYPGVKRILLGPGSVINIDLFMDEVERFQSRLKGVDIMVHPHAAIVNERHREEEAGYGYKIGSTMKGVGAALIQKIRRDAADFNTADAIHTAHAFRSYVATANEYDEAVDAAEVMMIEGAQGYSLGINSGFYPYTTSRECTPWQVLSDCLIPPSFERCSVRVYGVARTFPIRVANRRNSDGTEIGWSGPCYPDQREMTWAEVGQPPELTTVTRLPRRIFSFSYEQVAKAARMCAPEAIFLNFCNYMHDDEEVESMIGRIEHETGSRVRWTGWGPKVSDIREI